MTICIAITNFSPQVDLVTTYDDIFSKLLAGYGHRVLLVMTENNPRKEDEDEVTEEKNIITAILKKTYYPYLQKYNKYFRPGGLEPYSFLAKGLAIREWLLKNQTVFGIDIIQTHDYGGPGIFFCDRELPPLVIFGHGCLNQLHKYNNLKNDSSLRLLKRLEILSFQKADSIITLSLVNKVSLQQLTRRDIEFSITPWINYKINIDTAIQSNSIVVAAGVSAVKGAIIMAETMRICCANLPSLQLNWFGGNTYTAKNSRSMTFFLEKNYPDVWNKNFVWHDKISRQDVQQELLKASFVIIPSLWETFGFTALEAASAGKAIIITDKTGASYLFTHGHDAWIVPANDPEKLAEAIQHLYNDPELCKKLGDNAKSMVERTFNEKEIVEERIRLFQSIIQNRKPHTDTFEERLSFLKKYTAPSRKLYYFLRAFAKKLIGRGKNE